MINIAVDGPAGAGKSTIAKAVAKKMGFIYADTGALYRAVGLYMLENEIDPNDKHAVGHNLKDVKVYLKFDKGNQRVFLNEQDVSEAIRTPEASKAASDVSALPSVRAFLFDLQREIAKNNDCIMDGRDIGTVVLPDADVKIFLTASAEERADRRYKELKEKGMDVSYEKILKDINDRDYQDMHRDIAPLVQAEDSILIDSTDMTPDEVIDKIIETVNERVN